MLRAWAWKLFLTLKFSYLLFCNLAHTTETDETANRWETTNSKRPWGIIMIDQSKTGSSSQIIFITLLSGRCTLLLCHSFTSLSKLCIYICRSKTMFLTQRGIFWLSFIGWHTEHSWGFFQPMYQTTTFTCLASSLNNLIRFSLTLVGQVRVDGCTRRQFRFVDDREGFVHSSAIGQSYAVSIRQRFANISRVSSTWRLDVGRRLRWSDGRRLRLSSRLLLL